MSYIEKLRAVKNLVELSFLLDINPVTVFDTIHGSSHKNYAQFRIRKKRGGYREISAPNDELKLIQRRLASFLNNCLSEIEEANLFRKAVSHGFHPDRNIVSNASCHVRKRYVLNLDLLDFFGSINFGRVRGYFAKDNNFQLQDHIATLIAKIACHNNQLPQGSPCSPVISNLIGNILDARLLKIAKEANCYYTRFADDITFSTSAKTFPKSIAKKVPKYPSKWRISNELKSEIKRTGFAINPIKTRMQITGSRQMTTGLTVNSKVNIAQDHYRKIRSMCHSLFKNGYYFSEPALIDGNPVLKTDIQQLEGILSYLRYVKGRYDLPESIRKDIKFETPISLNKLYFKFLFYKYFIANRAPVIITEGKTDIIYLRCAIKKLYSNFPVLADKSEGIVKLKFRFVNPNPSVTEYLKLGSSSTQLIKFLNDFRKEKSFFHTPIISHPILIVLDNDDGIKCIKQTLRKKFKVKESFFTSTSQHWINLADNLYLIKTPNVGGKINTRMEDLFSSSIKLYELSGKKFDPDKKHGDESAYSKYIFAEYVVARHAKANDFTEFPRLLDGLTQAILNHYTLSSKPPTQTPS